MDEHRRFEHQDRILSRARWMSLAGRVQPRLKPRNAKLWLVAGCWTVTAIVCTGEAYKNVAKMTFANGAALKDPSGLFNSSLDGNARRAIDIHEGDEADEASVQCRYP